MAFGPQSISTHRKGASCQELFSSAVRQLLPVDVLRAIERSSVRFGENVEDVLASPARGFGVVVHGAHAPLGLARHGINGDPPQEANFLALHVYTVDERL